MTNNLTKKNVIHILTKLIKLNNAYYVEGSEPQTVQIYNKVTGESQISNCLFEILNATLINTYEFYVVQSVELDSFGASKTKLENNILYIQPEFNTRSYSQFEQQIELYRFDKIAGNTVIFDISDTTKISSQTTQINITTESADLYGLSAQDTPRMNIVNLNPQQITVGSGNYTENKQYYNTTLIRKQNIVSCEQIAIDTTICNQEEPTDPDKPETNKNDIAIKVCVPIIVILAVLVIILVIINCVQKHPKKESQQVIEEIHQEEPQKEQETIQMQDQHEEQQPDQNDIFGQTSI